LDENYKWGQAAKVTDIDGDGDMDLICRPVGFGGELELEPIQHDVLIFYQDGSLGIENNKSVFNRKDMQTAKFFSGPVGSHIYFMQYMDRHQARGLKIFNLKGELISTMRTK
jgi:hypothetical protein